MLEGAQTAAESHVIDSTTVSTMARAFSTTSGGRRPPIGWRVSARRRSGMPRAVLSSRANASNSSVPTTTVGAPAFSSSMAAWILHAVQEPQSALPTRTKSQVAVRSAIARGDAGPATGFLRTITSRTP